MYKPRIQPEVKYFHPRVWKWLERFGYERIAHEARIGTKRVDFLVKHRDWFSLVECKIGCNKSELKDAIWQVTGYLREIDYYLDRPKSSAYWTVEKFGGTWVLCCLAIDKLYGISFRDAFALCADSGVLLLNPGYDVVKGMPHILESRYPYTWYQLPLFDKIPYRK